MPAAHAVGDVPAQGKEAQQRAQFNVQHAGFKHRAPAGAVAWLGMAAAGSKKPARNVSTSSRSFGYFSAKPSPKVFGAIAA